MTTAEIHYDRPDHPRLLQLYIWQEYDLAPEFPMLKGFLGFWERELEGRCTPVRGSPLPPAPSERWAVDGVFTTIQEE
jgi:uncharacterized protein Usg